MTLPYRIELYDSSKHATGSFGCGIEILDRYLKERAGQESKKKVAAVYILREKNSKSVIGYYTLSSCSIEATNLPESIIRKLPKYKVLPAALIGRLALDLRFQKKKLGKFLLIDALLRAFRISREIGTMAVLVDAKDNTAKAFYIAHGFRSFANFPNRLYIPMNAVSQL